jgi:hypothetical protein
MRCAGLQAQAFGSGDMLTATSEKGYWSRCMVNRIGSDGYEICKGEDHYAKLPNRKQKAK